jgi:carbamoyl-phosphate synthase small subunit
MTAQAHEFWLDESSLAGAGLTPTHRHLNDGSVEGFACEARKIMGVLFNPEAEPGPRDSLYLFDKFMAML